MTKELLYHKGQFLQGFVLLHLLNSLNPFYTAFFSTDESRIGQIVEFGSTPRIFTAASKPRTRDYVEGRFG